MEIVKAQISKGTRDFFPDEVIKRNYLFSIIKSVFEKFAYFPIETPSFELLQTLSGKYGEEGDRLLFKILNSGDFLKKTDPSILDQKDSNKLIRSISKKGLRYDLTVPFARFVVQHQNELTFPFKRYQIQPVWRADRPQKGRYQEFYQCDVDVIGSESLMYEAELIQMYDEVFADLNINVEIVVNNRKILAGVAEVEGIEDQFVDMTTAIDKMDKIGEEGVLKEMLKKGIEEYSAKNVLDILLETDIDKLASKLKHSELGMKGVEEMKEVFSFLDDCELQNKLTFDPKLARGLNYYTGTIFEVKSVETEMGSLGGGGRYAELTAVFGKKEMSGVGISFGAERIYDLMLEKDLFPVSLDQSLQLLFVSFDKSSHKYAFKKAAELRREGIKTDIYPEAVKMKKQMKYANSLKIPYVAVIGDEEMKEDFVTLKNMQTGEQQKLSIQEVSNLIKSVL